MYNLPANTYDIRTVDRIEAERAKSQARMALLEEVERRAIAIEQEEIRQRELAEQRLAQSLMHSWSRRNTIADAKRIQFEATQQGLQQADVQAKWDVEAEQGQIWGKLQEQAQKNLGSVLASKSDVDRQRALAAETYRLAAQYAQQGGDYEGAKEAERRMRIALGQEAGTPEDYAKGVVTKVPGLVQPTQPMGWLESSLRKVGFSEQTLPQAQENWKVQNRPGLMFVAGIGGIMESLGGALMAYGKGGEGLVSAGTALRSKATEGMAPADTKVQKVLDAAMASAPFMLAAMGMAYGGIAAASAIGLGAVGSWLVGSLIGTGAARPFESATEAGQAYLEAKSRGASDEVAKEAYDSVFKGNMRLAGWDAVQMATAFMPFKFGTAASKVLKVLRVGGKTVVVGLSEGGEEVYQEMLQRKAQGDPFYWSPDKWDEETRIAFAVGSIMGAGMGAGGDVIMVGRAVRNIDTKTYDAAFKEAKREGKPEDVATGEAILAVAEQEPQAVEQVVQQVTQTPAPQVTPQVAETAQAVTPTQERAPGTETEATQQAVPETKAAVGAEAGFATLRDEYAKRGYVLVSKPYGRYEVKKVGATQEQILVLHSEDAVQDVDSVIKRFATEHDAYATMSTLHERMTGKQLWEMPYAEWEQWSKIHGDADALMVSERKRLFPDKSLGEVRQLARTNPNLVNGLVHKTAVERALSEGKPVPSEVLKDYPDLAAKYATKAVPETPVAEKAAEAGTRIFSRDEIEVGKIQLRTSKAANGTNIHSTATVRVPFGTSQANWTALDTSKLEATIHAYGDFAASKSAKKADAVWWVTGGPAHDTNAPLIANRKTYAEAVEIAKDFVESANRAPSQIAPTGPSTVQSAAQPEGQTTDLVSQLKAKGFEGTVDRLQRGVITEAQARGELEGTAKPTVEKAELRNPADIAAEWKARGMGRQESWSRWVQYTSLNPGMDAKDWYAIYDSVTASAVPDTSGTNIGGGEAYEALPRMFNVPDHEGMPKWLFGNRAEQAVLEKASKLPGGENVVRLVTKVGRRSDQEAQAAVELEAEALHISKRIGNGVSSALTYLARSYFPEGDIVKHWGIDEQNIASKVKPKEGFKVVEHGTSLGDNEVSMHSYDILQYPERYELDEASMKYVLLWKRIRSMSEALLRREGVKLNEDWMIENYFPRMVREAKGVVIKNPHVDILEPREYSTAMEALDNEILYARDPIETMDSYIKEVFNVVASNRLSQGIKAMGEKPSARIPMSIRFGRELAIDEARKAVRAEQVVQRARRGEKIPPPTILSVKTIAPELAAGIERVMGLPAAERLKAGVPLVAKAKALIETKRAAAVAARKEYKKALAVASAAKEWEGEAKWRGLIVSPKALEVFLSFEKQAVGKNLAAAATLNDVLRTAVASTDFSSLMIQDVFLLGRPSMFAKVAAKSFQVFFDRKAQSTFMAQPEVQAIMQRHPDIKIGMVHEYAAGVGAIERIPKIGKYLARPLKPFERFFGFSGDMARIQLAIALEPAFVKAGQPEQLGTFVNRITGVMNSEALGISAQQRAVERLMMFAPQYTRASLAFIGYTGQNNVMGKEAVKSYVRLFGAATAMYIATCAALGQEPQLDPTRPTFFTVKVGNRYVGIGGFQYSFLRFITDCIQSIAGTNGNEPLDFTKLADRKRNPITKWLFSRASPTLSGVTEALSQRDYLGYPLEDLQDWAHWLLVEHILPIGLQEQLPSDYEEPPSNRLAVGAVEAFGMRTFPVDPFYELANEYAEKDYGKEWGDLYKPTKSGSYTTSAEQKALLAKYPDLKEAYDEWKPMQSKKWQAEHGLLPDDDAINDYYARQVFNRPWDKLTRSEKNQVKQYREFAEEAEELQASTPSTLPATGGKLPGLS